jgi:hypothetical protein
VREHLVRNLQILDYFLITTEETNAVKFG